MPKSYSTAWPAPAAAKPETTVPSPFKGEKNYPEAQLRARNDKAFSTLRARLALAGYQLTRSAPQDGPPRLYVARWGLVKELASLEDGERFAEQVGAPG